MKEHTSKNRKAVLDYLIKHNGEIHKNAYIECGLPYQQSINNNLIRLQIMGFIVKEGKRMYRIVKHIYEEKKNIGEIMKELARLRKIENEYLYIKNYIK